jgi:hypothetical protein
MNSLNRLYAALGVLFCVGIAAFFVNAGGDMPRKSSVVREAKKLPAVDPTAIAAIEMHDPKAFVRLEKQDGEWVLPASFRAAVRKTEIDELLKLLVGFENAEHVAYDATDLSKYGLDPASVRRIALFDARGSKLIDLWVGADDRSIGKSAAEWGTYVRPDGATDVYAHTKRLSARVRANVVYWMEKMLFPDDPKAKNVFASTARRVELEFADLPAPTPTGDANAPPEAPADPADAPRVRVVLEAVDEEVATEPSTEGPTPGGAPPSAPATTTKKVWRVREPAGFTEPAFDGAVDGVVRSVLYAAMVDVAGVDASKPEYGLDKPSLSAEIRFADGSVRRVTAGARAKPSEDPALAGQPTRYATATGSTRVVRMNDYVVQQLRKKPEDFKTPEAPKPIDASEPPIALPDENAATRESGK